MDLNKVNKKQLIKDLVFFMTFQGVAHILMHMRYEEPLFNEKFVNTLSFILIGITVWHIFILPRLENVL